MSRTLTDGRKPIIAILPRFVTMDEFWVHHYEIEPKMGCIEKDFFLKNDIVSCLLRKILVILLLEIRQFWSKETDPRTPQCTDQCLARAPS